MPFMLLRKSWKVSLRKLCPSHLSEHGLVKAFNYLPAEQLGTNPSLTGQRQVVLVASNDADTSATVATVATQVGFAPVEARLGRHPPFMFWAADPAGFCSRTWLSSADCSNHSRNMLFLKCVLFRNSNRRTETGRESRVDRRRYRNRQAHTRIRPI